MSDRVLMTEVEVSMVGMVRNILSLNYTHQTAVKEYLNNVLEKNTSPDYEIKFNLKNFNNAFLFECIEENACGFESLEEITKAFRIADSERSGTNNMGYGIFSPITINKGHAAFGLFIQNNDKGSFFSVVYFGSAHTKLWTAQDSFSGTTILGQDVSQMIVPGGTRFVWITIPDRNTDEDDLNPGVDLLIKFVRSQWKKTLNIQCITDDTETDIMDLGKYYHYYMDVRKVPIYYGENLITPNDFLAGDIGQIPKVKHYDISTILDDGNNDYRIDDGSGEWKNFTKSSKNTIGEVAQRRRNRDAYHQEATISIYDIDIPIVENKNRKLYRKIWVKIGETYIFCEDFPLNGYPNLRVVLELENRGGNDFGLFISPDANKSNSKINPEIKDRISALVKYTIKQWHRNPNRVQISDTLKHDAWEFYNGNCCRAVCSESDCTREITAWKYDVVKIDEDEEAVEENLRTICKACAKKI